MFENCERLSPMIQQQRITPLAQMSYQGELKPCLPSITNQYKMNQHRGQQQMEENELCVFDMLKT